VQLCKPPAKPARQIGRKHRTRRRSNQQGPSRRLPSPTVQWRTQDSSGAWAKSTHAQAICLTLVIENVYACKLTHAMRTLTLEATQIWCLLQTGARARAQGPGSVRPCNRPRYNFFIFFLLSFSSRSNLWPYILDGLLIYFHILLYTRVHKLVV